MTCHYKGLCAYQYNSLLQVIIKVSIPNNYVPHFIFHYFLLGQTYNKNNFACFFFFFLRLLPWKRTHKTPREAQKCLLRMFYFYLTKIWLTLFLKQSSIYTWLHSASARLWKVITGSRCQAMKDLLLSVSFWIKLDFDLRNVTTLSVWT